VFAILASVNSAQSESEANRSDSRAALKAMKYAKTSSKLVAVMATALKQLSVYNSVGLLWVSGDSDVPRNEVAEYWLNMPPAWNTCMENINPEPVTEITPTTIRTEV